MADTEPENWPQRYRSLLDAAGVPAADLVDLSRPDASILSDDASLLTLADGLAEPARIRHWLDRYRATDSRQQWRAAAAVLHQDLSLQILAPLTIRLLQEGSTVLPGAGDLSLAATDGSPAWRWNGHGTTVDTATFFRLASVQLEAWYPLFRNTLHVAPGAYWSSAGLALSAPFSALYNRAPPERLCREATDWLDRFPCPAKRFIDWIPARLAEHRCALPQRRGCCLRFLTPAAEYCGTCGVYRKERMQALAVELNS